MCIFDKEFKKKSRKKYAYKSQHKGYRPSQGVLFGKNDKFVSLRGYRKI